MKLKTKISVSLILAFLLGCTFFQFISVVHANTTYSENLIPKMTSNSSPSGIASASSYNSSGYNLQPYYAFDHEDTAETTPSTFKHWESAPNSISAWLAYEFPTTQKVNKYTLRCRNYSPLNDGVSQAPKKWTFEGSNDNGITWTILDSQENITGWAYGVKKEFTFKNEVAYKKYRVNILENNAYNGPNYAGIFGLSEVEMMSALDDIPGAPINLNATTANTQVIITWNSVPESTGYLVKRSLTPGGPYSTIATNVTDTTYTDTNVINGTTYYYVVTAVNDSGESAYSNEASATPQGSVVQPGTGRAILTITLDTGLEKEYDLSMTEVNSFISWYEGKASGSGTASYAIDKHDNNKGPFKNRKDYVIFDKILTFEVNEYEVSI